MQPLKTTTGFKPNNRIRGYPSVKQAVVAHMEAHRAIIDVLSRLIDACKGDDRPDCPILDELSAGSGRTRRTAAR